MQIKRPFRGSVFEGLMALEQVSPQPKPAASKRAKPALLIPDEKGEAEIEAHAFATDIGKVGRGLQVGHSHGVPLNKVTIATNGTAIATCELYEGPAEDVPVITPDAVMKYGISKALRDSAYVLIRQGAFSKHPSRYLLLSRYGDLPSDMHAAGRIEPQAQTHICSNLSAIADKDLMPAVPKGDHEFYGGGNIRHVAKEFSDIREPIKLWTRRARDGKFAGWKFSAKLWHPSAPIAVVNVLPHTHRTPSDARDGPVLLAEIGYNDDWVKEEIGILTGPDFELDPQKARIKCLPIAQIFNRSITTETIRGECMAATNTLNLRPGESIDIIKYDRHVLGKLWGMGSFPVPERNAKWTELYLYLGRKSINDEFQKAGEPVTVLNSKNEFYGILTPYDFKPQP